MFLLYHYYRVGGRPNRLTNGPYSNFNPRTGLGFRVTFTLYVYAPENY